MSEALDPETSGISRSVQFTAAAAAGGLSDGLGGLPPIRKRSGLDDPGDSLGGLAGSCGCWCGCSIGEAAPAAAVGLRSFLGGGGGDCVEDRARCGGGGGAKGELKR